MDSGSGIKISDQQQCNFILRNRQRIFHKDFYSNGLLGTRIHPIYQQGTRGQPKKMLKTFESCVKILQLSSLQYVFTLAAQKMTITTDRQMPIQ